MQFIWRTFFSLEVAIVVDSQRSVGAIWRNGSSDLLKSDWFDQIPEERILDPGWLESSRLSESFEVSLMQFLAFKYTMCPQ